MSEDFDVERFGSNDFAYLTSYAGRDGASDELVAARLAGNVGDVLGGIDERSYDMGKLAGRVDALEWAQEVCQVELSSLQSVDRFADTRGLERMLGMVQDSLRAVQDGTGRWAGLVTPVVEDPGKGKAQG